MAKPVKTLEPLREREAVLVGTARNLQEFGYSIRDAEALVVEFRDNWMDPAFCKQLGIFWRSVDYVGHEGPAAIAQEIHYFQGLKLSLAHKDFRKWRREFVYGHRKS